MTPQLVHKDDCDIVRDHADYPTSAVLMDCNGDLIYRFDEEWSDDQIWEALSFTNRSMSVSGSAPSAGRITTGTSMRRKIFYRQELSITPMEGL